MIGNRCLYYTYGDLRLGTPRRPHVNRPKTRRYKAHRDHHFEVGNKGVLTSYYYPPTFTFVYEKSVFGRTYKRNK